MTAAPRSMVSYAEYLALEERTGERHEFLDGEAWAMAGGSPRHAELASAVGAMLRALARPQGCRTYSSDLKLRVSATGFTSYADVVVVCGEVETAPDDRNAVTNPTVIVEVLSASTESYDRGAKFAHYRRIPSLRAYVLVGQDEPRVEVFERDGAAWTITEGASGERVTLRCLNGALDVTAVYDG